MMNTLLLLTLPADEKHLLRQFRRLGPELRRDLLREVDAVAPPPPPRPLRTPRLRWRPSVNGCLHARPTCTSVPPL